MEKRYTIGVVGTCGTGKSELVTRLNHHGIEAHHIAQEHSFNPQMWQLVTNPDFLVYLRVSYEVTLQRKNFDFTLDEYNEQLQRLSHAHAHADLEIDTDHLTPEEVFKIVMNNLVEANSRFAPSES